MSAPSRTSDIYQALLPVTQVIRTGTLISIDPSIGSTSSMPAYAIYHKGSFRESSLIEINPRLTLYEKAQILHIQLAKVYKRFSPEILIYEEIPDQAYIPMKAVNHVRFATGNSSKAHATLLKALGVILGCPGPDYAVGLRPTVWKKRVREDYVKGDVRDAEEIGFVAIQMAVEIDALVSSKAAKR